MSFRIRSRLRARTMETTTPSPATQNRRHKWGREYINAQDCIHAEVVEDIDGGLNLEMYSSKGE